LNIISLYLVDGKSLIINETLSFNISLLMVKDNTLVI